MSHKNYIKLIRDTQRVIPQKSKNKISVTYKSSRILLQQRIVTFGDSSQGIGYILWRVIVRKALTQVQWLILQSELDVFDPNQT